MSSFYEDASLVMIPSGYKTSKVYSAKPTDGAGDLSFTRSNDTATRVGPDGLIEKVRTNLFTYSEQLENGAWTKTDTTIVANAVANPLNGAVTSDKMTDASTATTARYTFQSPASIGTIYTSSGYFKKAEYNFVTLHAFGINGAVFNLDTGVKVSQSGGVGNITSVGDGWYRCTFSFTAGGSAVFFSQSPAGNISYAGTTGSGIYAFGLQVETGDIATDYIATTTAAVSVGPVANVPRLDYLGSSCPRLLLEPQRTNLALFSESFDNAGWTKFNASVTANDAVSPDGYTNADALVGDGTNSYHYIINTFASATSGTAYTASFFAKKGSVNFVQLVLDSSSFGVLHQNFDLLNGTIGSGSGSITPFIESYGNDWYRVGITATATASVAIKPYIALASSASMGRFASFATSGDIKIYGASVELGAYATSYIPTLGAAVTRGADNTTGPNAGTLGITGAYSIFYELGNYNVSVGSTWLAQSGAAGRPFEVFGGTVIIKTTSGDVYPYSHGVSGSQFKGAITFDGANITAFANGVKYGPYPANLAQWTGYTNLDLNINLTQTVNWKQVLLFPIALSDADAIALTA